MRAAAASLPPPERYRLTVAAEQAGERLDRFLASALGAAAPGLSRSRVKTLITEGHANAGGAAIIDPSHRVKAGAIYELSIPAPVAAAPAAQAMALEIVYEDAHLIVVNKPAGLVVHPAPGNPDRTLVNALIAHCGESLSGIGGERRPGIVHRLDKDTSGLIVAAKTDAAHAELARQFATREIERVYAAIVWGVPSPASGEIGGAIGRDRHQRKRMSVVRAGGKAALTRYRVERVLSAGSASLVECRLATGRTHQIRVHLAHAGHPLIGDPVYGGRGRKRLAGLSPATRDAIEGFRRQALHARTLGFRHPASGQNLHFEAPLPDDMAALLAALEK